MFRKIVLSVALLMSLTLSAQINIPGITGPQEFNYIPNPSFEENKIVPCFWNQGEEQLKKWFLDWTSATATTPDLLSSKSKSTCWSHPMKHNNGKQYPHTGASMMGIKIFGLGGTDTYWHEYLQVPLKQELKADSLYHVSVWVALSSIASQASNNIGIAMLDDKLDTRNRLPLYIKPVVNHEKIIKPRFIGWKKVKGVFKATGSEKFLVIGNFYGDEITKHEKIPGGKDGAYYYIDDVMLRKAKPHERLTGIPKESFAPEPPEVIEGYVSSDEITINKVEYKVGAVVELKNISFEFDDVKILTESELELVKLRDLLFDYPFMEILIKGHTDNVGNLEYNQKLSEKRAASVYNYLIENDIDKSRLSFKGFGSSKPLSSNDTEIGQEENRRVEFEIIKQ
jgi:OOP family OmpA-OmpF porin